MDLIRIDLVLKVPLVPLPINLNVVLSGTTGTYYVFVPLGKKGFCVLEEMNAGTFNLTEIISAANSISSVANYVPKNASGVKVPFNTVDKTFYD